MKDLIAALVIFQKYKDATYPTSCSHDLLLISEITKEDVSEKDTIILKKLGFFWMKGQDAWGSFRFGSC